MTLISREGWEAACAEIGRPELSPGARRANLVVEGVDLARSIGGGLRVGECLLRIVGETRPCRLMDDAAPGLQKALEPETRGGVYGRVVVGGKIEVGDAVVVVAPGADELEGPQRSLPLSKRAAQGGAAE